MVTFNNKTKKSPELGFGQKNYNKAVRFINRDGSINIRRTGLGMWGNFDIYHWFITTSKTKLIFVIITSYIITNILFASTYYLIGPENFGGLETQSELHKFMSLFFFSAQTLTTVGYGHIFPRGFAASAVSAIESLMGLLGFALATGILFGRFSRPKADLMYSEKALIAPYMGITGLMFRITNKMQYELIECEASLTLGYNDPETKKREFETLKLEINRINFLTLSWTIVHPIDDESPIKGLTIQDLLERDAELIILIKAINDTFSQNVHSRYSYKANEMVERAKFKPLKQEANKDGKIMIQVNDINVYEELH
ncbi:MAG: ion channel [Bacteroidia bacterium]